MNKRETHIVTGMTKDLAVSRFEPSYVYDAHNIRIRTVGDNSTMLSVTNEKGTAEFPITSGPTITGIILGTASFSDRLVLFTKVQDTDTDYIYKILFNENFSSAQSSLLFEGDLNLQFNHPLETLALYENESIRKVYWVDGLNQPRVINIETETAYTNPDIFNFNREIGADAKIEVTKFNTGGEFRPGTIQYCFNYFNKFGQETNIVDVSPLYYISPKDSGLAADDISSCSFQITFEGLDTNFEYVRLYAIYRSSENATPNVRIVGDYKTAEAEVIVRHISEEFEEIPTESWQDGVEVPFENLWIVNSNVDKLITVHDKIIASEQSGPNDYTMALQNGEYFFDDRTGNIYDVDAPRYPNIRVASFHTEDGSNSYFMYTNSVRTLMVGSYTQETLHKNITVIDTGVYGSTIDAEALLFLGGQYLVAGTLAEKDNTLFLGNIKSVAPSIGDIKITYAGNQVALKDLHNYIGTSHLVNVESCAFRSDGTKTDGYVPDETIDISFTPKVAPYERKDNNRSSRAIKVFKVRENYRLGFIAQYKTGQWSEAIWLGDFTEEEQNGINHFFPPTEYEYDGGTHSLILWGQQLRSAGFSSSLATEVVNALIQNEFIKIAPVVVYPQLSDRLVVCQGLLCPSVFNISDRVENAPFSQCDWRFRKGYSWDRIEDEIQLNVTNPTAHNVNNAFNEYAPSIPFAHFREGGSGDFDNLDSEAFRKHFGTEYYLDPSLLTFHSPDLDSSDELLEDDIRPLKLRLVGYSNGGFITTLHSLNPTIVDTSEKERTSLVHYYTEMESAGYGKKAELLISNVTKSLPSTFFEYWDMTTTPDSLFEYEETFGGPLKINGYRDRLTLDQASPDEPDGTVYYSWWTYLWHRNGALNGQYDATNVDKIDNKKTPMKVAQYSKKVTSEKTYGYTTYFCNPNAASIFSIDVPTNSVSVYSSDSQVVFGNTQFKSNILYYGTSNKVLTPKSINDLNYYFYTDIEDPSTPRQGANRTIGYFVRYAGSYSENGSASYPKGTLIINDFDGYDGVDPVQIKYGTTRHAVVSLQGESDSEILQLGTPFDEYDNHFVFWLDASKTLSGVGLPSGFYQEDTEDQIIQYSFIDNCIYIGELYRDMSPEQLAARFGGTSQDALIANTWTIAGDAVKLVVDEPVELLYKEGDTYFGRYDCLKSYPFSQEDKQSIVSIYSTEIESRVNLDFRYGKTMNLDDNTMVTPQNFNLYNHEGYEQTNQYFTYKSIDYDRYSSVKELPNTITWSLEKTLGEDVDTWTSIPLTSTLDLDGTKGEITKLARFNNEIFAFQDNAFAQILFNSRVQIPVSDGVPVEITNGYKVDGKRYISESIGMQNKWSLGITPYSMYFVDDNKNSIFAYNGQLTDLSAVKGMKSWDFMNTHPHRPVWNPLNYGNIRTFYDKIYNEVYFTTESTSLVYSELLNNFTSFLDYGKAGCMVNMGNKYFAFPYGNTQTLHELWAGEYNYIFGKYKPYSLTFVANADPTVDKVFNNLEWRSTMYKNNGEFAPKDTFDTLRVWHEHQDTGNVTLRDDFGIPSSLKKKFNAFRAFVPRDTKGEWSVPNMQRIRNPWTYVRLSKESPNSNKLMFTDLNIDFFE